MPAALNGDESLSDEIDMERVVADSEYRRRVISRLRRERRSAKAQVSDDSADLAAADED
jgi:hypothetical protein